MTFTPESMNSTFTQIYASKFGATSFKAIFVWGVSAFEVILICESQADVIAVASGAFALLGVSSTEAGDTATLYTEVTIRTVSCRDQEETQVLCCGISLIIMIYHKY